MSAIAHKRIFSLGRDVSLRVMMWLVPDFFSSDEGSDEAMYYCFAVIFDTMLREEIGQFTPRFSGQIATVHPSIRQLRRCGGWEIAKRRSN